MSLCLYRIGVHDSSVAPGDMFAGFGLVLGSASGSLGSADFDAFRWMDGWMGATYDGCDGCHISLYRIVTLDDAVAQRCEIGPIGCRKRATVIHLLTQCDKVICGTHPSGNKRNAQDQKVEDRSSI